MALPSLNMKTCICLDLSFQIANKLDSSLYRNDYLEGFNFVTGAKVNQKFLLKREY